MKRCRPLLGTYVEIQVDGLPTARALDALDAAFAAVERVQSLMSVFNPDSDVSRINRLHRNESLTVAPETWAVLALAQELHRHSAGLFDCGIAPHLSRWGFLPQALKLEHGLSSIRHLRLEAPDRVHCLAPLRLDLGGIAKGYAVDQAADVLLELAVPRGLINAGGDLRVIGDREEAIQLRDPREPARLHFAGLLKDGALATSGCYFSRREADQAEDGLVSALVHPHTGSALQSRASYSVIAPRCAVADGLTKVLALSGDVAHPAFAHFSAHPLILQ